MGKNFLYFWTQHFKSYAAYQIPQRSFRQAYDTTRSAILLLVLASSLDKNSVVLEKLCAEH